MDFFEWLPDQFNNDEVPTNLDATFMENDGGGGVNWNDYYPDPSVSRKYAYNFRTALKKTSLSMKSSSETGHLPAPTNPTKASRSETHQALSM